VSQLFLYCPEIFPTGIKLHGVGMTKGMDRLSFLVKFEIFQVLFHDLLNGLGSPRATLTDEEGIVLSGFLVSFHFPTEKALQMLFQGLVDHDMTRDVSLSFSDKESAFPISDLSPAMIKVL